MPEYEIVVPKARIEGVEELAEMLEDMSVDWFQISTPFERDETVVFIVVIGYDVPEPIKQFCLSSLMKQLPEGESREIEWY